jgi:hypothetical protein
MNDSVIAYRETIGMYFVNHMKGFLCFVDHPSRYNRVKKNQHDTQLIFSIFRQPLHVSGVSRPIIRRHNRMYTTVGTYYSLQMTVSCRGRIGIPIQPQQQTVI